MPESKPSADMFSFSRLILQPERTAGAVPQPGIPAGGMPLPGVPEEKEPPESVAVPVSGIPESGMPEAGIPVRGIPEGGRGRKRSPEPKPVAAGVGVPVGGIPEKGIPEGGTVASIDRGYYQTFNDVDDSICPGLHPYSQVVLRRLYRLSHGYRQTTCRVGLGTLAKSTNMARSRVQVAITDLVDRGLVVTLGGDAGGTLYEVLPGVRPILPRGIPVGGIPPSGMPRAKAGIPPEGRGSSRGIPAGGNIKEHISFKEQFKGDIQIEDEMQMYRGLLSTGYTVEMIANQFLQGYPEGERARIVAELAAGRELVGE